MTTSKRRLLPPEGREMPSTQRRRTPYESADTPFSYFRDLLTAAEADRRKKKHLRRVSPSAHASCERRRSRPTTRVTTAPSTRHGNGCARRRSSRASAMSLSSVLHVLPG